MTVFGKGCCIGAKWLLSGKSGCNRALLLYLDKTVVLGQSGCIRAKVVVFGQSGCFWAKMVVVG